MKSFRLFEDECSRISSRFVIEQNPDIVLVHYLNVPYPDDNKMAVITPSLALWGDKKEWTKEELVCQLKPMCMCLENILEICIFHSDESDDFFNSVNSVFSEDEPDATNEIEITVRIGWFFNRRGPRN